MVSGGGIGHGATPGSLESAGWQQTLEQGQTQEGPQEGDSSDDAHPSTDPLIASPHLENELRASNCILAPPCSYTRTSDTAPALPPVHMTS